MFSLPPSKRGNFKNLVPQVTFWIMLLDLEMFFLLIYRYGEIFKTRILGYPCVMLASPEAARFVLVTHAHMFKPTYPRSKEKLIGPSALFFHQGDYHSHIRKLVQSSLYPETIRKLIPDIEHIALSSLQSWANMHIVSTYQEMKKVNIFSYVYKKRTHTMQFLD